MKLFCIMITTFYFSVGFHMRDMFVAGKHTMSSGGPEMFPILRSRKYLHTFLSKQECERFELFVSQI